MFRTPILPTPGLVLFLLLGAPANALVFDVNSTDDAPDAAINGVCGDAAGACTLRAAVQEANANPGVPDEINVPAGTYVLKEVGADEDTAATGDLDLTADVTIVGAGADLTSINGKKDRVFQVFPGVTAVITDLTVTKGKLGTTKRVKQGEDFDGGGLLNEGSLTLERVVVTKNNSVDDGGGIAILSGALVLTDVLISKNKAKDDAGGLDQDGGTVSLMNVTFEKNKAKDEGGAAEAEQGMFVATNVTFSQNKASEGGGMNGEQGAVIQLTNVTFYKNKAKDASGAIQNEDGVDIQVTNGLFDQNKKANCLNDITSNGGNLDTGASCLFGAASDQSNVSDAGLEKLGDNGGAVPTHALEAGSPAVDAGVQVGCPATDQRGQPRNDGACDVGAFEL